MNVAADVNRQPILYSFRRCPYAMRARMALLYAGIDFQLREIVLRDKPKQMLEVSPKGTVPVLILPNDTVIDESRDIMFWAIAQNDPDCWYPNDAELRKDIEQLIDRNDIEFKPLLDRYKYADRYPELSEAEHRRKCEIFLVELEQRLAQLPYLVSESLSMADIALMPFLRQFSRVDLTWFKASQYHNLERWLNELIDSELFTLAMQKHPVWAP